PLILSVYGSVTVTVVFAALLCWFLAEAQGGGMLGLAERLTTSIEAAWPFAVAIALRRTTPRTRLNLGDQAAAHAEPLGAGARGSSRLLAGLRPRMHPQGEGDNGGACV